MWSEAGEGTEKPQPPGPQWGKQSSQGGEGWGRGKEDASPGRPPAANGLFSEETRSSALRPQRRPGGSDNGVLLTRCPECLSLEG